MQNDPLILHLKYEYYAMIQSGIKTIEYREYKPYWQKRLKNKKEIIFIAGYKKCNLPDLKATIDTVHVIPYTDLPDYAQKLFKNLNHKDFYAIKFKLTT